MKKLIETIQYNIVKYTYGIIANAENYCVLIAISILSG